jgi:hypothetical protein
VDLEFVFTRPKKQDSGEITPSQLAKMADLKDAIVWGVDPGLRDIFVACDEGPEKEHRVRNTSTPEYYHLLGSDARMILHGKLKHSRPDQARIISQTPSFKTSSPRLFVEATKYVLKNYAAITVYYDRDQVFNKIDFGRYIAKQKAVHEIAHRLLTGSTKYKAMPIQSNTGPSTALSPPRQIKMETDSTTR